MTVFAMKDGLSSLRLQPTHIRQTLCCYCQAIISAFACCRSFFVVATDKAISNTIERLFTLLIENLKKKLELASDKSLHLISSYSLPV